MSHIVSIHTQVRDATAVRAACQRLGIGVPQEGTHRLFSSQETGLAVQLSGWNYPVVCDLVKGELKYDNYGERWGKQSELHRFLQAYAVEAAKLQARKQGHSVIEQPLSDGSIKLTIQVGGVHA